MTRPILLILGAIILISSVIGIVWATRPRPELPARWNEPEDDMAPGELPTVDPRTTAFATYLRGWQGEQAVYHRVGREWPQ